MGVTFRVWSNFHRIVFKGIMLGEGLSARTKKDKVEISQAARKKYHMISPFIGT